MLSEAGWTSWLKYTFKLNPHIPTSKQTGQNTNDVVKKMAFGMLSRNKLVRESMGQNYIKLFTSAFKDYVPEDEFAQVTNSITSGTANLITAELQQKQKAK